MSITVHIYHPYNIKVFQAMMDTGSKYTNRIDAQGYQTNLQN